MFGLEPNELGLVVFLAVLITVSGWLPRLGEWLGELFGGAGKGADKPGSEPPTRRSRPPRAGAGKPGGNDPGAAPPAG